MKQVDKIQIKGKELTMHTSEDFAKITGRSDQNTNPFSGHCENSHCILRIRLYS